MDPIEALSSRMDRMETALARITDLLEGKRAPAAPRGPSEALSTLISQLGEPDTVEALGRIAALAPQLEYAAYAAAAGPELLEDALEGARKIAREQGMEPHEAQRRLTRAAQTVVQLSGTQHLELAKRLADLLPAYMPLAEAAAHAMRERCAYEGSDDLQGRMVDALLQLSDPGTQEALIRIAGLAPQLEYAAYFVAAGPELLEEAMDLVRAKSAEHGIDPHVMAHRLGQATDLLILFTAGEQVETLRQLGRAAPHAAPVIGASARVLRERAELEGAASIEARLYEALLELSDPDTLGAVTRIAALAPQLEYAAYFAAAGPELLDETVASIRGWANRQGVAGIDQRLEAGMEALVTLTQPSTLRGLAQVSSTLASISDATDTADSLRRLVSRLPRVERTVGQVERALDMLSAAAEDSGLGSIEELEGPAAAGLQLLRQATRPEILAALEKVIALAPKLARIAGPLLDELDEFTLDAIMPQPDTVRFLASVNEALGAAQREPAGRTGMVGLLGALGDQDVQRVLNFGVRVSRHLSSRLNGHAIGNSG